MKREEELEQQAFVYYESCSDEDIAKSKGFIEGAKWSDRNPVASESYHRSKLVDWQQVRIQAAIAAMKGICSNSSAFETMSDQLIVKNSIGIADALVEKLKGENP